MKLSKKFIKVESCVFEIDYLHTVLKNSLSYCRCFRHGDYEHVYICELIEKKIKEIQDLF